MRETIDCGTWWMQLLDFLWFEVLNFGLSIHGNINLNWRRVRIVLLPFFDKIVIWRKLSNFFSLLRDFLSLVIFKTLNLLWQRTFHIDFYLLIVLLQIIPLLLLFQKLFLKLLLGLFVLVLLALDDFQDIWFKFAFTDGIKSLARMVNDLIIGSSEMVPVSSAWVVCVVVADRGLIVVDCDILIGPRLLNLPLVTNAVWSWSIDGIL